MNQKKDILRSVAVLTVICLVVSAALAVVNSFTKPVSLANAAERENEARRAVTSDADNFVPVTGVKFPPQILSAYAAMNPEGQIDSYVFTVTGKGFGGDITVMCAIDMNARIVSCSTLDISGETKTLGGRVAEAAYTDQYAGKDASLDGVDTISGATVTSLTYEACVKKAFEAYEIAKEANA